MTQDLSASLQRLIEHWSDANTTVGSGDYYNGIEDGRRGCADELAAVLAALPREAERPAPPKE
jgi:hypothetical protein